MIRADLKKWERKMKQKGKRLIIVFTNLYLNSVNRNKNDAGSFECVMYIYIYVNIIRDWLI